MDTAWKILSCWTWSSIERNDTGRTIRSKGQDFYYIFGNLADRTARTMIGYWHDNVVSDALYLTTSVKLSLVVQNFVIFCVAN